MASMRLWTAPGLLSALGLAAHSRQGPGRRRTLPPSRTSVRENEYHAGRVRDNIVRDRTRTILFGTVAHNIVPDTVYLACPLQGLPQGETLSRGGRLPWGGLGAAEPPRCPCPSGLCGVTWTLPPTVTMAGDGDFQRILHES